LYDTVSALAGAIVIVFYIAVRKATAIIVHTSDLGIYAFGETTASLQATAQTGVVRRAFGRAETGSTRANGRVTGFFTADLSIATEFNLIAVRKFLATIFANRGDRTTGFAARIKISAAAAYFISTVCRYCICVVAEMRIHFRYTRIGFLLLNLSQIFVIDTARSKHTETERFSYLPFRKKHGRISTRDDLVEKKPRRKIQITDSTSR